MVIFVDDLCTYEKNLPMLHSNDLDVLGVDFSILYMKLDAWSECSSWYCCILPLLNFAS